MWYKMLQFYVKRTIINVVTYIIKPRYILVLKIDRRKKDEKENIILSDYY